MTRDKSKFDVLGKIEKERTQRNWTEYTLAKNAGITQSTISTWYRRKKSEKNTSGAAQDNELVTKIITAHTTIHSTFLSHFWSIGKVRYLLFFVIHMKENGIIRIGQRLAA